MYLRFRGKEISWNKWVEVNLSLYVAVNNISVVYVMEHRCAGGLKRKLNPGPGFYAIDTSYGTWSVIALVGEIAFFLILNSAQSSPELRNIFKISFVKVQLFEYDLLFINLYMYFVCMYSKQDNIKKCTTVLTKECHVIFHIHPCGTALSLTLTFKLQFFWRNKYPIGNIEKIGLSSERVIDKL